MQKIYRATHPREYEKAGPSDLIALEPPPGGLPICRRKMELVQIVFGMQPGEITHSSGPSGTGKTTVPLYLEKVPKNWETICRAEGLPAKPLKLFPVQMSTYESPAECWGQTALRDGSTFQEQSLLVRSMRQAEKMADDHCCVILLREMGRVASEQVQGGLTDLLIREEIILPDGGRIQGGRYATYMDSNYQDMDEAQHTLSPQEDAIKRRITVNVTMGHLQPTEEAAVLRYVVHNGNGKRGPAVDHLEELIGIAVRIVQAVREQRREGRLLSIAPPSIYNMHSFVRMCLALPQMNQGDVARATLMGNATAEDLPAVEGVYAEVFGLAADSNDADPTMVDLF
ncbi:MAG: AAA family ATPase [Proteobacteria bacterium]|nr:AAA family ATPase [Pseudomonadota bacterium]